MTGRSMYKKSRRRRNTQPALIPRVNQSSAENEMETEENGDNDEEKKKEEMMTH